MRIVAAVVLVFEAIVIGLAVPVAINLGGIAPGLAAGLWGGMALAALVLSGLQRFTWAHYAAWALQAAVLFSSFWVDGMLPAAIVFASLWVVGVIMGRRIDERTVAVRAAASGGETGASFPNTSQ
ncbi:DUF4233 domain-containing protein [Nocardiopsis kunsanensis]|uniref:DUF4233 domain-containing protein n=1 Tax=Nocardiopsis kunsanensis TaxID=141693 RepID=A0A919CHM9_9ACTN|nr:DUF4233 domain-containing protein [Nocardiopsis kunsanensis]GHD26461.1 hypothetical protein GCM10007147_24440 [Nocardiopsis kunsanensis]